VLITENERSAVIREILSIQRVQADSVPKNTAPGQDEVQGRVKFFNTFKGYGFIEIGHDQQDVFVYLRTLRNCGIHNLIQGQELLLNITDEGKGPQATEIRLLSSE
jgi:CspA family cold shock protein